MQTASTRFSHGSISGYSCATSRKTSRNRPSVNFMMFAFVTQETRLRPWARAYSNAKRMMRAEASRLIGFTEMPEPAAICLGCSLFNSAITRSASSLPASYSIPA